jgi:hypothetical protein
LLDFLDKNVRQNVLFQQLGIADEEEVLGVSDTHHIKTLPLLGLAKKIVNSLAVWALNGENKNVRIRLLVNSRILAGNHDLSSFAVKLWWSFSSTPLS